MSGEKQEPLVQAYKSKKPKKDKSKLVDDDQRIAVKNAEKDREIISSIKDSLNDGIKAWTKRLKNVKFKKDKDLESSRSQLQQLLTQISKETSSLKEHQEIEQLVKRFFKRCHQEQLFKDEQIPEERNDSNINVKATQQTSGTSHQSQEDIRVSATKQTPGTSHQGQEDLRVKATQETSRTSHQDNEDITIKATQQTSGTSHQDYEDMTIKATQQTPGTSHQDSEGLTNSQRQRVIQKLEQDLQNEKIKFEEYRKNAEEAFENERSKLMSQINSLEKNLQSLGGRNTEPLEKLQIHKQQTKIDHTTIKELQSQLKMATMEKNEALSRLSEMAGRRLVDNNPSIADLSTEIRPTKIAENFKQLYDNEWTELFEELTEKGESEEKCIQILLDIVKDTFLFATKEADDFEKRLGDFVLSFPVAVEGRETLLKDEDEIIKQLRRVSAQRTSFGVQKEFINQLQKDKEIGISQQKYVKKCLELCWFMAIQTPRMAIEYKVKLMQPFNEQFYARYTKSGNILEYVVWPCTRLHENGPVLSKGVAQATTIQSIKAQSQEASLDRPEKMDPQNDKSKSVDKRTDISVDNSQTKENATNNGSELGRQGLNSPQKKGTSKKLNKSVINVTSSPRKNFNKTTKF